MTRSAPPAPVRTPRVRKLATVEARQLFPVRVLAEAPRPERDGACAVSASGQHHRVDLHDLRFCPTPAFCAWCGATI